MTFCKHLPDRETDIGKIFRFNLYTKVETQTATSDLTNSPPTDLNLFLLEYISMIKHMPFDVSNILNTEILPQIQLKCSFFVH